MKRLCSALAALAAATSLAGCGEITNTLSPPAATAGPITVAVPPSDRFAQVGIYEAQATGMFAQTDLNVSFLVTANPLAAIEDGRAQVALSAEPSVILARNQHIALASVAAVVQVPGLASATCRSTAKPATAAATRTTATALAAKHSRKPQPAPEHCRAAVGGPAAAYAKAPTYNALNFVVTENEIVSHAPVVRRFVQAVGRGYIATRSDPAAATTALTRQVAGLNYGQQLAAVEASLSDFFPTGGLPWGFQNIRDWNSFGSWLLTNHVITDVNAPIDASTNELLAGQGV